MLGQVASAEQLVRLKSGLTLRGSVVPIPTVNQNAFASASTTAASKSLPIWMVDDGLRRVYVHKNAMVAESNPIEDLAQKLTFYQPAPTAGRTVGGIGPLMGVSPFNNYGQRIVNIRGTDGSPISIIQGIKEINARYATIEALRGNPTYQWESRIATSSIPADQLKNLFTRRIDQQDYNKRLEVVRFYIEAERFGEARSELEAMLLDFPEQTRLATQLRVLVQRQGTQLLAEAKLRRDAGQYKLAIDILQNFPLGDVARVTAIEVQDAIDSIRGKEAEAKRLLDQLRQQIRTLGQAYPQHTLLAFVDEIESSITPDTLSRLSDYTRLGGVDTIAVDNRVALAIGGWLLGPGSGLQNLSVATSLITVRDLVAKYLGSSDPAERTAILDQLRQIEGADATYVSKMLPLMKPPLELPAAAEDPIAKGLYRMTTEFTGRPKGEYAVQLPPDYDPLRSYPCIVALGPVGASAEAQIDYWSGRHDPAVGMRLGQGDRHGFVVVAPVWTRPGQRGYESTPREHAEVLAALRDAMRRVSIDADRIFIAGLADGGAAAWDIALSHPEYWAGMINIGGEPTNYIRFYAENAVHVPMMFVFGEIAGSPVTLVRIGDAFERYMKSDYNAMVVTYRGRGPEHYYEEIHHLFAWMNLPTSRRKAIPKSIETVTMRRGDQFFWWLELTELSASVAIDPFLWDQAESRNKGKVVASVGANNEIRIAQGPSNYFRVFLEPSMGISLDQRITVRYRSRSATLDFNGGLDFMLEDVRTRGDRKRPFWAMVSIP
ncbi:MAG TPA: alpha/beta hydrolase [Planctomycetaceae bacterium]|nr:alpha/beta hydrolase [Planctomycetaceae bacterium]